MIKLSPEEIQIKAAKMARQFGKTMIESIRDDAIRKRENAHGMTWNAPGLKEYVYKQVETIRICKIALKIQANLDN